MTLYAASNADRHCNSSSAFTPRSAWFKRSERDGAAQAEDRLIADALCRVIRIDDAAAGVEHILKVRLQLPPGGDGELVGDLDEGLGGSDRRGYAGKEYGVAIERSCAAAHP